MFAHQISIPNPNQLTIYLLCMFRWLHFPLQRILFLYMRDHSIWKGCAVKLTIIVDDAGSGDLLYGVVVGAYRDTTEEFKYELIDVKFFQPELFSQKEWLQESSRIVAPPPAQRAPKPHAASHL